MKYRVNILLITLLCIFSPLTNSAMESIESQVTIIVSPVEKTFDSVDEVIEPTVEEQQEIVVSKEQTKSKVKSLPATSCCCCMSCIFFMFKHMRCLCKCFRCLTCCCSDTCVDCLCKE